jgi:hypothetical protein
LCFAFATEIPEENLDDEKRWVRLNSAGVMEGSAQTRNYYISNMVYNQKDVKSLDQTQFFNENKRFKIKIYYKNSDRNEIFIDLNTLSVNNDNNEATVIEEYKNIKLENIGNNMYISDFCIGTIGDIGEQNRNLGYYKYSFKMSFNNIFNLLSTKNRIQVKVNQIKKEIGNGKYPAYAVFAMHNLENGEFIQAYSVKKYE